jgi:hypothetical protein
MKIKYLLAVVAVILLFATPTALDSCAIAAPEPVFMTVHRPADPDGEFMKGKIGVIVPAFDRTYLIAAYRYLSGRTITAHDADAFRDAAPQPLVSVFPIGSSSWDAARKALPGALPTSYLSVYKQRAGPTYQQDYRNCLDDAFLTAASTLQDRASRWGTDSANLREWLAAQDEVFQNCSGKTASIPKDPDAAMDPLLSADREYQIAAAHFYAGEWEQARRWFKRVSENADSPWREIAPYLIARVYLREGIVDEKAGALEEAHRGFQAIVNDPAQQEWQGPSANLLDFAALRIRSEERLRQYAAEISGERPAEDLAGPLLDFKFLFDHTDDHLKLAATSDLADWLLAMRGEPHDGGAHVLDRWRNSHNNAWLIAALSQPWPFADADLSELVQTARNIKPENPGYESAAYYGIDAEVRRGHRDEARQWTDQVLTGKLLLSSRNRILSQRLRLVRNWNEFLLFAPRQPEPNLAFYDGDEVNQAGDWVKSGELFDVDSTLALNRNVPLLLLADGAHNPRLPKHLQTALAQAGFVRSLVLGRSAQMRDFMQRIVELNPAAAGPAKEILSAPDAPAAHFAGILLLLRTSAPEGMIESGAEMSDYHRANYAGSIYWGFGQPPQQERARNTSVDLGFLTPLQRSQGDLEWKTLQDRAECGATYAENEAIQWAMKHPDDNRVPEALHFVVQATFRGCGDRVAGRVGKLSHQAFQLLHQRYPNSEWTKKTKYWYK